MTDTSTYTDRSLDEWTVKAIDGVAVTATNGWSAAVSPEAVARLHVGKTFQMETRGISLITGQLIDGVWYGRKSDQDLDREHAEMVAEFERDKAERLAENREDWQTREEALPLWIRERILSFHTTGGEAFELDGWGYELAIAELAVLFTAPDFDGDEQVEAYCSKHGVSGNQYGMARSLAQAHHLGHPLAGTVSALTPLTGNADYSDPIDGDD